MLSDGSFLDRAMKMSHPAVLNLFVCAPWNISSFHGSRTFPRSSNYIMVRSLFHCVQYWLELPIPLLHLAVIDGMILPAMILCSLSSSSRQGYASFVPPCHRRWGMPPRSPPMLASEGISRGSPTTTGTPSSAPEHPPVRPVAGRQVRAVDPCLSSARSSPLPSCAGTT